jgi:hypothetical protein
MCRFPLGVREDDDFLSHTLSPEGANASSHTLILKGVNAPIWILKPNARRFPLGKKRAREGCAGSLWRKEGCGRDDDFLRTPLIPLRSQRVFPHPLSPEGANAPIRI